MNGLQMKYFVLKPLEKVVFDKVDALISHGMKKVQTQQRRDYNLALSEAIEKLNNLKW